MGMGYGINSIGNDACFREAYNSYNPSFQAAQAQAQQQYQQYITQQNDATRVASIRDNSSLANLPKANYEETSVMPWIIGGLALATAAGYCIYKKKSPWGIIKEWGSKIKGAVSSEATTSAATKELKAVVKDGKVSFLVPGKTVAKTGTVDIAKIAKEYGIDLHELTKMTKQNIKSLDGGVFLMDGNKITFKGDKIVEILNGKGDNITGQILKKATVDDKAFAGRIEDFIKNAKKLEKGWAKDLIETSVTTQVGDNVLQVTRNGARVAEQATVDGKEIWQIVKDKGAPSVSLNRFETLERLSADNEAVLNYYRNNPAFKDIFTSTDFTSGKYLKGTEIETAFIESADFAGKKLKFNNGKLVGFYEGGKYYPESHEHFGAFIETGENKKKLADLYTATFKDGNIPTSGVQVILKKA